MLKFASRSGNDTERIGGELSGVLRPGAFVALYGGMGAGKTAFVRGFARALGWEHCASPTFTIVHEYGCVPPVYHFDAYRLSGADEFYESGCEEYFSRGGIVMMEWPEIIEEALPKNRVNVCIDRTGDDSRTISIDGLTVEEENRLLQAASAFLVEEGDSQKGEMQ